MNQHKIFQFLFLALCFVSTFTFTGCKNEGCTNEFSDNFDADADEDDGSCILSRDKFIATWNMMETCPNTGDTEYPLIISASSSADNGVIVTGDADANATISGSTITMPNQDITIGAETVNVEGTGSISNDVLTMTFIYSALGLSQTCTAVGTKQ